MRTARRGLSPLVAAVVLISATIVGGMLVYQYFQTSLQRAQGMAGGLAVQASSIPLDANTSLVSITITNNYNKPVKITGATGILTSGATKPLTPVNTTSLPTTIAPGDKATLTFKTADPVKAVQVQYEVDGASYTSEPVTLG